MISNGEDEATGRTCILLERTDGKVHFTPIHGRSRMPGWPGDSDQMSSCDFGALVMTGSLRWLPSEMQLLEDRQRFLSTAARLIRRCAASRLRFPRPPAGWVVTIRNWPVSPRTWEIVGKPQKTLNTSRRTSHER